MLESFKLKPYDLEPVYTIWVPPPPTFTGAATQSVDDWLTQIKVGCTERSVPREYWHKVAQHYMSPEAKARLDELKSVMQKVHGGHYRWSWDKFKIAMRNMGWNIDVKATETVKVEVTSGGRWWLARKNSKDEEQIVEEPLPVQADSKSNPAQKTESKFWTHRRPSFPLHEEPEEITTPAAAANTTSRPPASSGSKTLSADFFRTLRSASSDTKETRPTPQKSRSDTAVVTTQNVAVRSDTVSSKEVGGPTGAQAPIWLINACNALDFLNNEHPKVMSTLSAILITAGTLPTIPAVAAGAGGAVLASGAAHAVGAIAVGLGSWLKASQNASASREASEAASK